MPRKKPHWTQLPENKKKVRAITKKALKAKARKQQESTTKETQPNAKRRRSPSSSAQFEIKASWLAGYFAAELHHYAQSNHISEPLLAGRVAGALQRGASR